MGSGKGKARWGKARWGKARWGKAGWGKVRWGKVRRHTDMRTLAMSPVPCPLYPATQI